VRISVSGNDDYIGATVRNIVCVGRTSMQLYNLLGVSQLFKASD